MHLITRRKVPNSGPPHSPLALHREGCEDAGMRRVGILHTPRVSPYVPTSYSCSRMGKVTNRPLFHDYPSYPKFSAALPRQGDGCLSTTTSGWGYAQLLQSVRVLRIVRATDRKDGHAWYRAW